MICGKGLSVWKDVLAGLELYFEIIEKRFLEVCIYVDRLDQTLIIFAK